MKCKNNSHYWEIYGEVSNILPSCEIVDCQLICKRCNAIVDATISFKNPVPEKEVMK